MSKRFRKLPVEIEAMQWTGDNTYDVTDWVFSRDQKQLIYEVGIENGSGPYLVVSTLEGLLCASPNDWVIRGINGEFYPCKPDIFEKTYEAID